MAIMMSDSKLFEEIKRGQTVARFNLITAYLRAFLVVLALTAFSVPASALEISDLDTATSSNVDRSVGQVAQSKDVADEVNDPIESFNRGIFAFNEFFLDYILSPLTQAYQAVLPDPLEQGIGNFLHNLKSPIILLNDLLQGEWERASITSRRFFMNTTLGLGGVIDLADHAGMPRHKEDLGQTFAVWGISEGPYLVIPFLGPSNPRHLIGRLLDGFLDPVSHVADNTGHDEFNYLRLGLTAVDEFGSVRKELKEIKKTSIDYYASIRSLYRQKRASDISNGKEQKLPPIPDFLSYDYDEPLDDKMNLSMTNRDKSGVDVY
jgi:phospholipid-binding lipoprotein MlaA